MDQLMEACQQFDEHIREFSAPRRAVESDGRSQSAPAAPTQRFRRKAAGKKETMANSDDKPTMKITLEDLAAVELPAQAPQETWRPLRPEPDNTATLPPLLTALPIATEEKGHIFLKGWFYLGIAGLVGSLAGWGICEPFFSDGSRKVATLG